MSPAEIQVKINIAQREADYWRGILAGKSCAECKHGQSSNWCNKYQAAPPKDVQKVGCDDWCWCEIPF